MTRASLQALRRTITVEWKGQIDAGAKAHLLKVAREGNARTVAEQTARAGVKPTVEAYANNQGNTNLDSVKLPGPIVYNYGYLAEIVQAALKALIAASPRDSGDYIRGHTVFIDGAPVTEVPESINSTQEVMIVNVVPYARRIEVGKTEAGRDFVIQVDPHIYERVAKRIILPKYRTVANIEFNYADLPGAYVTKGGLGPTYLKEADRVGVGPHPALAHKRRQKPGTPVRYPAILIGAIR